METTLHRQLKALYAPGESQEVALRGYRIDAIADDGRLVEIQQASLGAISRKVARLLEEHRVLVVKPLAARTYLVTRNRPQGQITSARYSPSRESWLHVFLDLVHFVGVFPHPRLTLEVVLTEQEEHRVPARRRRWRSKGYRVTDRLLRCVHGRLQLETAADLATLLPAGLAEPFSTADLARAANIPRWLAQKMAYCLRKTGTLRVTGKQRNAVLYETTRRQRAAA
jgi:hypothetical protein